MNRKEQLIAKIEHQLKIIEKELIDTPSEMSFEKYQERIDKAKQLRETLEIIKNL